MYESFGERAQCHLCERHCVVPQGETGFCATRKNIGGHLYTLMYGDVSSISANPIEKKPFFHFFPGTKALTVGGWSCNFTCPWCQNFEISKTLERIGQGHYMSPEAFIELVGKSHCRGTSISFNEPTLFFEYSLDIFEQAKQKGYYNTYVTNGYITKHALDALIQAGLDAMNIDIKGNAEMVQRFCGADVEKVWRNALFAKERGVWIELTTLIIPAMNDNEEDLRAIARRIKKELGRDTPWHVTGYHPAYKFRNEPFVPPTPVGTLENARAIGVMEGLDYVYIGNVPGHPYENTYCPRCSQCLIERFEFNVTGYHLTHDKHCPSCREEVPVIGVLQT